MKLAVIPARGGSKRIPRKNIRSFAGQPMISWSIQAALQSNCFDRVIISTDDAEIAAVAREWGAEVPFLRPAALSDDYTPTMPVIANAIAACGITDAQTAVCCIYATAPFVQAQDLQAGLTLLDESGADFVFGATSYGFPIQRALRRAGDGRVTMFSPEHFNTRSQDLEEAWHDAGQFYWGRAGAWSGDKPLFGSHSAALVLPRHRVQDIDTSEDWIRAEWLFAAMRAAADG